jgi:lipopolysaccharide export LptBFGC system permease protein LptF
MNDLLKFLDGSGWGDFASIAGLAIALIGFAFTLYGISKSRSAAESAENAAQEAKTAILRTETISNFSSAVTVMEEVKRLHRAGAWEIMPDRYSYLKKSLISILSTHTDLTDDQRVLIQSAVIQFRELESSVENYLSNRKSAPNSAKLNKIVTAQIDKLDELLNMIKTESK